MPYQIRTDSGRLLPKVYEDYSDAVYDLHFTMDNGRVEMTDQFRQKKRVAMFSPTAEHNKKAFSEAAALKDRFAMLITLNTAENDEVQSVLTANGDAHPAALVHCFLSFCLRELDVNPEDIFQSLVIETAAMLEERKSATTQ
jgi:hypothetical protein